VTNLIRTIDEINEEKCKRVCKSLLSNGYTSAIYKKDASEAVEYILFLIPQNSVVGVPGSVTVRQLRLIELLEARGCLVHQHWDRHYTYEDKEAQNHSDWYITSCNAITLDGKIISIDGAGNRISSMAWGNNEIIYVVGMNKVTSDIESALSRAHNLASPANAKRVAASTPCVVSGRCIDCNSPERICRAVLILERCPINRKSHVILIGQDLGY
jgi:hypothetical protein